MSFVLEQHAEDPARTADYGALRGENVVEPKTISDDAATDAIMRAIRNDGYAHGMSAEDLVEVLLDTLVNVDPGDLAELILHCKDFPRIKEQCGVIANETPEDL